MVESNELILVEEDRQLIFNAPVDTGQITRAWEQARSRYLHYIYTRHGTEVRNLRPNTRQAYETALSQFFDGMKTQASNPQDTKIIWPMVSYWQVNIGLAQAWKDILASAGKPLYGLVNGQRAEIGRAGLSAASIKLKLAALKGFYDFVSNVYQVPYNPHLHDPYIQDNLLFLSEDGRSVLLWNPQWRNPFNSKAIRRGDSAKKPVYLSTTEVERILARINTRTVSGKRDFALFMALWSTACRSSEILSLKWGDLAESANGNFVFSFRGKSGKVESVELDRRVWQWICVYLEATGRLEEMGPDDYIFTALDPERVQRIKPDLSVETNRPLSNKTANGIMKKYARRAGVEVSKAHLHALRHGRARHTLLEMKAKNGSPDIGAINRLLRHASLDMTDHYTRMMDEPEDQWAEGAILAVIPRGDRRNGRPKAMPEQLPLEPPAMEITRLRAEVERLKQELGKEM